MLRALSRVWRRAFVAPETLNGMARVEGGWTHLGNEVEVRVSAFYLDLRPVTNREYWRFIKATGARTPGWITRRGFADPDQPVVGVTHMEAMTYARWLGKRLPSEAEWIRAARSDGDGAYPWGEAVCQQGLAWTERGQHGAPAPCEASTARRAGAGPWGHRDLIGNVWEWCQSGALRGGFWGSTQPRIDDRLVTSTDTISAGFGFRCAH